MTCPLCAAHLAPLYKILRIPKSGLIRSRDLNVDRPKINLKINFDRLLSSLGLRNCSSFRSEVCMPHQKFVGAVHIFTYSRHFLTPNINLDYVVQRVLPLLWPRWEALKE